MPEPKMPDVLAMLVSQLKNTGEDPRPDASTSTVSTFIFQVGQGGVVQFVVGKGVLSGTPDAGLKDG